jgi:hypothetical protein
MRNIGVTVFKINEKDDLKTVLTQQKRGEKVVETHKKLFDFDSYY